MVDVKDFERHIQSGGFAFQARATAPAEEFTSRRKRGRPRKTPEYRDPDTVKMPQKKYKPKRAAEHKVVLDPVAEVGCTAQPALPLGYAAASWEAEKRVKAGHRQGQCAVCMRWRWHDEPCAVAVFVQGKKPRYRQPSPKVTP